MAKKGYISFFFLEMEILTYNKWIRFDLSCLLKTTVNNGRDRRENAWNVKNQIFGFLMSSSIGGVN
jgi:hypothetical protein